MFYDRKAPMSDNAAPNPLSHALRAARRHLWAAALFSGLVNILYLAPSIFMLQVYDRVVPTRGGATLLALILVLIVTLAVFAVLDLVRMRLLLRASVRLEKLAAPAILHRILDANRATVSDRMTALRNFDTVRGTLVGPAVVAVFDAPWTPVYLIVCFLLHAWIGLLAVAALVLLSLVAFLGERATRSGIAASTAGAGVLTRSQDYSIATAEVGRALGMRDALVARHLSERASVVADQGLVARTSGGFLATTKFLRLLFQSLALALGAWLAIRQSISAGAIFAASLLVGRALQPVEQILGAWKNVTGARAAYQGLSTFLTLNSSAAPPTTLPAPEGLLDVERVFVRAPGSDKAILKAVSFSAKPGEVVALVGPSGAGKSTLLRALVGAIRPDAGEVRIDGAKLSDWDAQALGGYLGYMPQTPTLFPASVHANISRFSRSETSGDIDAAVIDAARRAGAHEMILRLPQGYDTMLSIRESGGLSAGQRQLVALARALFGRPRFLFLDEPNAHLDTNGEVMLAGVLAHAKANGITTIVSTHRTGLLQVADHILLLRDGEVEFFKSRAEAMAGQSAQGVSAPQQEPKVVAEVGA
ncbi:type I secretion system permease/ATPase [Microvirga sp. SRT01]|uniref:Type I secretion system permease/ATPase n=1 Tax=Sphingomonas longa TaxID=2778730 RepID=A0ABS2D7X1_9SPHN|nr:MULTISPECIES: type I secretion system permease/ATPase [Alphaproteobacteria]MBM6577032.1 type I secretion system permease/ATPase [Sphingomonas sp. BT552]MBR7710076.1 type I secretion system permease/ATPase [Microvirga sp. SRT01]